MTGPCAKKVVKCTLVMPDGTKFIGTNECNNPQVACPRLPGEGYEKCKSICQQPGHAEEQALERAGGVARGAVTYLEGIDHYCANCQRVLITGGVIALKFGRPE